MPEKWVTVQGCSHCTIRADCTIYYPDLCNMMQLKMRAADQGERLRSTANGRWKGEA